jgi:hypothetical protein
VREVLIASSTELIGLIYDAVPDASRWSLFLEAFVQTTGCKRGTLILNVSEAADWMVVCRYGWRGEETDRYNASYASIDPWGLAATQVPEGEVRTSTELCSEGDFEKSAAYREFYGPLGINCGFGGTFLRTPTGHPFGISREN